MKKLHETIKAIQEVTPCKVNFMANGKPSEFFLLALNSSFTANPISSGHFDLFDENNNGIHVKTIGPRKNPKELRVVPITIDEETHSAICNGSYKDLKCTTLLVFLNKDASLKKIYSFKNSDLYGSIEDSVIDKKSSCLKTPRGRKIICKTFVSKYGESYIPFKEIDISKWKPDLYKCSLWIDLLTSLKILKTRHKFIDNVYQLLFCESFLECLITEELNKTSIFQNDQILTESPGHGFDAFTYSKKSIEYKSTISTSKAYTMKFEVNANTQSNMIHYNLNVPDYLVLAVVDKLGGYYIKEIHISDSPWFFMERKVFSNNNRKIVRRPNVTKEIREQKYWKNITTLGMINDFF